VSVAEVTVAFREVDTVRADEEVVVLMDEMEAVLVDEVAVVLTKDVGGDIFCDQDRSGSFGVCLDGEVKCDELAMLDSEDVVEVEIMPAKSARQTWSSAGQGKQKT
jgi:hypothetical protein